MTRIATSLRAFVLLTLAAVSITAHAQTAGSAGASASSSASAPSAPSSPSTPGESMLFPGDDFLLQPGDLVSVQVFLQPDYQSIARVGLNGTIQLPFIGSVPVQGLTVKAAQSLIADRLREGQYYRDPDVIIRVLDTVNGSVIVTGEVHATIPVATQRSLKDVLLTAGGLPANASHTVKIVRKRLDGTDEIIVVDLGTDLASSEAANVAVHPHDIIQVTRASVVYVLGAFAHQGAVPLDQASPLTLLQLAALSGGIGFEGRYSDLRLIRTVGSDRKVVVVDIKKIREGKAVDPILQANDIVFLPTNSMKAALKSTGTGGIISLVSLLIALHPY
jgi:polysaccharide export outer membrane protein